MLKTFRPRWIVRLHQPDTLQWKKNAVVWVKRTEHVLGQIRAFEKYFCVDKVEVIHLVIYQSNQHTALYTFTLLDLGFIKWVSSFFQVQFRTGPKSVKIMGGLSSLTIYDLWSGVETDAITGREIPNVWNPGTGRIRGRSHLTL